MIQGLGSKQFRDWSGGRMANQNPASMPENHCTVARNVFFLGDGVVRRRSGYTSVLKTQIGGEARRGFDFQRNTDKKGFVILSGNRHLGYMDQNGTGYTDLSSAENPAGTFDFIANDHSVYTGDGHGMYRLIDNGDGKLTKRNWGLDPALVALTIATGAGSLTLTYGRSYVACPVARWTDSQGTPRYHIGAPSPLSAHTGPQTAKVITVGNIQAATDPQVTHWWIFATMDMPFDTSGTYYFAAEVTNGTTSWGDTLTDAQLDTTRLAPWNNLKPPVADAIVEYQNRAVWLVGNLVYVSGFEEIDLGDPLQTSPTALIFPVPGGTKSLNGAAVLNQGGVASLLVGTPDYWFRIDGYSAATLVKRDRVIAPGPAGKKAIAVLPNWIVWIGTDKKLWAWDGNSAEPIELSLKVGQNLFGDQLTLDSLDDAQLSNAEVLYYGFGKYFWIVVLASTKGKNFFDWVQIWDGSNIVRRSYSELMQNNTSKLLAESDMFPADPITTGWIQRVGASIYMFLGDSLGNVYRFPDGFTDNGNIIRDAAFSTIPSQLDTPEVMKAMISADLMTNRPDCKDAFKIYATATEGVIEGKPVQVNLGIKPGPGSKIDPTTARALLASRGCSVGTWAQIFVTFPADDKETWVSGIDVNYRALYQVAP